MWVCDYYLGRMTDTTGNQCVWKLLDSVDGRNEQLTEVCWCLIWSWDADDLQHISLHFVCMLTTPNSAYFASKSRFNINLV